MSETPTLEYSPGLDVEEWPEVQRAAAQEQRRVASLARRGAAWATINPAPVMPGAIDWIKALPKALRRQIRDVHAGKVIPAALKGMARLQGQFGEDEIHLAVLDDDGLIALAAAQAAAARAADGYSRNEPPGRPEHDRRFNMQRLRQRRAEVIICMESATDVLGDDPEKSNYSGEESRRIRDEARKRTAEWMQRAGVYIPEHDALGRLIGEKIISFAEAGSTRHKSYSEFLGFTTGLHELAAEEERQWMMVTTNCPAEMHPSSPRYDGKTTPKQANRWLSKQNKAALDLLRKWGIDCAGVRTREPHQSGVPHAHSAIAHTARQIAEQRYQRLIEAMKEIKIMQPLEPGKKRRKSTKISITETELLNGMSRAEFIDGMLHDIIECAFHRYFLEEGEDERDDGTGRLLKGVGVDIKHDDDGDGDAAFSSYVTTYIIKSFAVDYDKLPKNDQYDTAEAHTEAVKDAVREQVESGGDLAVNTWASAHRIRTRELFGIPSRSPWKALGKVRDPIGDEKMEAMRLAILDNQHADYLRAQGGLNARRGDAMYRIHREVLPSNYPLRQDMLRRRVLGVMRHESDPIDPDTGMQPAAWHRTRIDGCRLASNIKPAKAKKSTATPLITEIRRTCTELPKSGAFSTPKPGTAPPPTPQTLH